MAVFLRDCVWVLGMASGSSGRAAKALNSSANSCGPQKDVLWTGFWGCCPACSRAPELKQALPQASVAGTTGTGNWPADCFCVCLFSRRIGQLANQLRPLAALAEDLGFVPNTHLAKVTTAGKISSKRSDALFWLHKRTGVHTQTHKIHPLQIQDHKFRGVAR